MSTHVRAHKYCLFLYVKRYISSSSKRVQLRIRGASTVMTSFVCILYGIIPHSPTVALLSIQSLPQLDYKFKMDSQGVIWRNGRLGNVTVVCDVIATSN